MVESRQNVSNIAIDWLAQIDACKDEIYSHSGRSEPIPSSRQNSASDPLVALGEKYRPTKRNHNYLPWYNHVFSSIRHDVRTFVEIGVQTERSVLMWEEYFPNARIIGVDIDPSCKQFERGRVEIYIGDQTNPKFLKSLVKDIGCEIDIVVDDGLHTERAIFTSLSHLYPALGPYGIYAIEDIINLDNVNQFLMEAIRAIQYWPNDLPGAVWPVLSEFDDNAGWFVRNTIGIEVYRFLAFLKRGFNPRSNPYFLDPERFFFDQNTALSEADAAARTLIDEGKEVTMDTLVQKMGFQKRHVVQWYLSGMKEASFDGWRKWLADRRKEHGS